MNSFKYIIGFLLAIPISPYLFWLGKKVRQEVPEPIEPNDLSGTVISNAGQTLNLWVLGESTMAGVGVDSHQEGFAGTLAKEIALLSTKTVNWQVIAKSGYTAQEVQTELVPKLPQSEENQHLIVIGLGGNDAFELHAPKKWRKSILKLIDDAKTQMPKAPIVFINMPPIADFPAFPPLMQFFLGNLVKLLGKELVKAVKTISNVYAIEEVITLEEWQQKLGVSQSELFSDGVHPSGLSYQIWARETAKFVAENRLIS